MLLIRTGKKFFFLINRGPLMDTGETDRATAKVRHTVSLVNEPSPHRGQRDIFPRSKRYSTLLPKESGVSVVDGGQRFSPYRSATLSRIEMIEAGAAALLTLRGRWRCPTPVGFPS